MFDDNTERLHGLCERASEEQDREKMRELTKEIQRLLGERQPNDFEPYAQRVRLTASDCSGGCKWFHILSGPASLDWGVCGNPARPRAGLLTFEHQGCPEFEQE